MNERIEEAKKPVGLMPSREIFEITRMGLPLSLRDNIVCFLVIVLAVALQIRLSHTFLAEGFIAFAGFIGYLAMRYWLLTRRYPQPGDLVIDHDTVQIPASINNGQPVSFSVAGCSIKFYVNRGRHGESFTSVVFRHGIETVKINSFAIDLSRLAKVLSDRGVTCNREYWQIGFYAVGLMFVILLGFFLYMALTGVFR